MLRKSHSDLQELRSALQESRTVAGTSLAFFNSFQKPHMLTALVMAFDNAQIKTVISSHKRTVVLVCYVQEVFQTPQYILPSTLLYSNHGYSFTQSLRNPQPSIFLFSSCLSRIVAVSVLFPSVWLSCTSFSPCFGHLSPSRVSLNPK